METKSPPGGTAKAREIALLSAVCGLWSAAALSATTAHVHCNEIGNDLDSLEAPAELLATDSVDHVAIEPNVPEFETLQPEILTDDTVTPILFLAPRVASVLKEVFGTVHEDVAVETQSTSPLADIDDPLRAPATDEAESPALRFRDSLPQIQRQMYRIDI